MKKPVCQVFIPDYPKYFVCSHYSSYKFRIELYEKDGDVYEPVYYHDDVEIVKQIASALNFTLEYYCRKL